MLSQLDHLLRRLLTRRVAGITADDQIGFDPPDDAWAQHVGTLGAQQALNVYLAEIRENRKLRSNARTRVYENGWVADLPAPARMDCHYLISAWSPAVVTPQVAPSQDEHTLLYATTVALIEAAPLNAGRVYAGQQVVPAWPAAYRPFFDSDLPTEVLPVEGFPKYAEFWGTMGQGRPWRPGVYLVVTIPVVPDEPGVFGPPVTTIRTDIGRAGGADVLIGVGDTLHVIGGTVRDAANNAVRRAWVGLETTTNVRLQQAETDADGRFRFEQLAAGRYRLHYAAGAHPARTTVIDVPSEGAGYDLAFPA